MAIHAVTGAFGYSGSYIAKRLLEKGHPVRTLTGSPERGCLIRKSVEVLPYSFDEPKRLCESLRGVDVLHNTYWIRFNHRRFSHSQAVDNTLRLFEAAHRAGVRRVVHISITNPSLDSDLEYFRGKAVLEDVLQMSGLSYAILRPAVLFGGPDILVNNIAWVLRRFPVFGMFGDGQYRIQPIHVDDLASLAVEHASRTEDVVIDAIGPETFSFGDLVETLGRTIGKPRPIVPISPKVGFAIATLIGQVMGDVFLTRDEITGLMRDLLCTDSPPVGSTRLSDWARKNAHSLGRRYSNELERRQNRVDSYETLGGDPVSERGRCRTDRYDAHVLKGACK